MMALSAREMGYSIVTLDPTPNSPCGQVADRQVVAEFNSIQGAKELAKSSDVITYEFENIGANIADFLQEFSHLPQGYDLLFTTQHRLREKQAIEAGGGQVAPYRALGSLLELRGAAAELGLPLVLKTCSGGYDGKGQWVIRDQTALDDLAPLFADSQDLVAEQYIPFVQELSVIVAGNARGEVEVFPVAENIHRNNILHITIAPARVGPNVGKQAAELGRKLASHFDLVGLLAIELFLLEDGALIVNELAPRPHNSGHFTQQACGTNQFEQHIRGVCNLPLDRPEIFQPTVMVNILGKHLPGVIKLLPQLNTCCKVHLYGKKDAAPNRKMGHMNVSAPTVEQALQIIQELGIWD